MVSAVPVPSEPSAPALGAADAAPAPPIAEPVLSPTATDVDPIPVDLEVDDSADTVVGEDEIASPSNWSWSVQGATGWPSEWPRW